MYLKDFMKTFKDFVEFYHLENIRLQIFTQILILLYQKAASSVGEKETIEFSQKHQLGRMSIL